MVLLHSRKKYAEWLDLDRQACRYGRLHPLQPARLPGHAMGGVPRPVACDQTKLAVIREEYADAKVHETTGRVPLEAWQEEVVTHPQPFQPHRLPAPPFLPPPAGASDR